VFNYFSSFLNPKLNLTKVIYILMNYQAFLEQIKTEKPLAEAQVKNICKKMQ
jgi:hypothetical protein